MGCCVKNSNISRLLKNYLPPPGRGECLRLGPLPSEGVDKPYFFPLPRRERVRVRGILQFAKTSQSPAIKDAAHPHHSFVPRNAGLRSVFDLVLSRAGRGDDILLLPAISRIYRHPPPRERKRFLADRAKINFFNTLLDLKPRFYSPDSRNGDCHGEPLDCGGFHSP